MATSDVKVSEGTGKNVATYSISEDTETKQVQRVALNSQAGADLMGALSDAAWSGSGDPVSVLAVLRALVALLQGNLSVDDGGASLTIDAPGLPTALGGSGGLKVDIVGGSSSNTEYVEDAAAAANPSGGQAMLRRRDTLTASEVSADGDVIAANATSKGELYVKHADAIPVTGTFWQATQPVSAASLPLPSGAATAANQSTLATEVGALTETAPASDTASSGLNGRLQRIAQRLTSLIGLLPTALDGSGGMKVAIVAGSTAGTEYTEDAAAATNPAGGSVILRRRDTLASETSADGDNVAWNGTDLGEAYVNDATGNSLLAGIKSDLDTLATADPANDAVDSGSPVKIGGIAKDGLAGRTLVAANDRTDGVFGRDGALHVRTGALNDIVRGRITRTDGTEASLIAAAGSGLKNYLKNISVANMGAAAVTVDFEDGAGGTVLWTVIAPPGGGVIEQFGDCPIAGSANTALYAKLSGSPSGTVTISASGFKSQI